MGAPGRVVVDGRRGQTIIYFLVHVESESSCIIRLGMTDFKVKAGPISDGGPCDVCALMTRRFVVNSVGIPPGGGDTRVRRPATTNPAVVVYLAARGSEPKLGARDPPIISRRRRRRRRLLDRRAAVTNNTDVYNNY